MESLAGVQQTDGWLTLSHACRPEQMPPDFARLWRFSGEKLPRGSAHPYSLRATSCARSSQPSAHTLVEAPSTDRYTCPFGG